MAKGDGRCVIRKVTPVYADPQRVIQRALVEIEKLRAENARLVPLAALGEAVRDSAPFHSFHHGYESLANPDAGTYWAIFTGDGYPIARSAELADALHDAKMMGVTSEHKPR